MDNTDHIAKVAGISSSKELISPLSSITPPKESHLKEYIDAQLIGTKGTYSIVVLNLITNETYFLNEHTTFKSASLYKLWVMATAYELIKQGKLKETDSLSQDLDVLHNRFGLASPSALIKPAVKEGEPAPSDAPAERLRISMTVGEALEKMITISDNYSALLLTERVKLKNITAFLDEHGFDESMVGIKGGDPITTAYDSALFMKKLYAGELANKEHTEKMLTLLKRQRLNGKLPKYLSKETIIAHKTGELDAFSHDVGIVYAPPGEYIIAVLTETTSRQQADERIANVSQTVYKYFGR